MFIAAQRTLDLACPIARVRLLSLIDLGELGRASHSAYQGGFDAVLRVGPWGDLPGAGKLVAVRFLEPVERAGVTTVGLRWEATGPAAGLFPVLDANITLMPEGEHRSLLAFDGTYRAPFGRLGAALDKALLHRLATTTVSALLTELAAALASPAVTPVPASQQAAADPGGENPP